MPFVKISSLKNVPERDQLMKNVEQALYDCIYRDRPLMPKNMATCLWQTLDSVVHKIEVHHEFKKEEEEIPVFVDLYVNTNFNQETISLIMKTIADTLSKDGKINRNNVFIHAHVGMPGYVFISGEVTGVK